MCILKSVRVVIALFRKSPVRNSILQRYVLSEHGKELSLLLDCKTRWNTIGTMIERFLLLKSSIFKALDDLKLDWSNYFSSSDILVLENILNILKPIKIAVEKLGRSNTNILESEAVITFLLDELIDASTTSTIGQEIFEAIKHRIGQRRNAKLVTLAKYLHNPQSLKNVVPHEI